MLTVLSSWIIALNERVKEISVSLLEMVYKQAEERCPTFCPFFLTLFALKIHFFANWSGVDKN